METHPSRLEISRQFTTGQPSDTITLRGLAELPAEFRPVFAAHPYFNILQSMVFDQVIHSDAGIVVSAPTGCGKTGVFELAICRMLMNNRTTGPTLRVAKAIYLAPIKALCDERYADWSKRFGQIGCKCCKLTGDTDSDEFSEMKEADIVVATPEKWDSMTRRWKDNEYLVKMIRVFMIDEIHLVGDASRGATLETVVSRMKAISQKLSPTTGTNIRFVAVSATLQNIEDFGEWLSMVSERAVQFKLGEGVRPVQIEKFVVAYPWSRGNDFKFDISLDYKLPDIIGRHSAGKPTLVFCATRKSTERAAGVLKKQARFTFTEESRLMILQAANSMRNLQLADAVRSGIGFHHAGLDRLDRNAVEEIFVQGYLPVLLSTSTLAMGVNLPAHLVVIKSTSTYSAAGNREYSETDIMQMIGRAGRPQFDTTAVAVIMTKLSQKAHFEKLTRGNQVTESVLHKQLVEHVNAEISLKTFSNSESMLAWLKSTFLYLRIFKNPEYYDLGKNISRNNAHNWLQNLCSQRLSELKTADLIDGNPTKFQTTLKGSLMAKYYIAFSTMTMFGNVKGDESLSELLLKFCDAKEFADVQLRVNEKMLLNTLNRNKNGIQTIRFPMKGKISTTSMKVNCLIQATLGSLPIPDHSLSADAHKIMRAARRVAKCLVAVIRTGRLGFSVNVAALQLAKCLEAHMWENSQQVARQIKGVGPVIAGGLVEAGCTSFPAIAGKHPREIEICANRRPPFGNQLLDAVDRLPKYELAAEQTPNMGETTAEIIITVTIRNREALSSRPTAGPNHAMCLLIGDTANKCLLNERLIDADLMRYNGAWSKKLTITRSAAGEKIRVSLISETMIGLDTGLEMYPLYTGQTKIASVAKNFDSTPKPATKLRQTDLHEYPCPVKKRKSDPKEFSPEIVDENPSDSYHFSLECPTPQPAATTSVYFSPPTETGRPYSLQPTSTGDLQFLRNPSTPPGMAIPSGGACDAYHGYAAKSSGIKESSMNEPGKFGQSDDFMDASCDDIFPVYDY